MAYPPIDPSNPLFSSTSPVQPNVQVDTFDDLDIMIRVDLIKATAPNYAHDIPSWKKALNEMLDWVYGTDEIQFNPDAAKSEE